MGHAMVTRVLRTHGCTARLVGSQVGRVLRRAHTCRQALAGTGGHWRALFGHPHGYQGQVQQARYQAYACMMHFPNRICNGKLSTRTVFRPHVHLHA